MADAKLAERPRYIITPSMICREALVTFVQLRKSGEVPTPSKYPKLNTMTGEGCFAVAFGVPGKAFEMGLERFSTKYLVPAMTDLATQCAGVDLGAESLRIPVGVLAVNERYDGISLRVVLVEDFPVDEARPYPKRVRRYYDVVVDEWKTGPTTVALRFDVHKPGVPFNLVTAA